MVDFGRPAKAVDEWHDVFPKDTTVTVTQVEDNKPNVPEGFEELKVDPPVAGTHSYVNGAITLTFYGGDKGIAQLDFSSTKPIYYLFVKGGEGGGGNLYKFDPYALGCKGLYANLKNGNFQNISHVVVYYKNTAPNGSIKIVKKIKEPGKDPVIAKDVSFTFSLYMGKDLIGTKSTDKNGEIIFDGLSYGKYILYEVDKDGYKSGISINGETIILETHAVKEVTVINEKEEDPKYDIKIKKQIKEDGSVRDWKEGDPEFTFKLKLKNDPNAVEIPATTVNGEASFNNLEAGVYTLTEVPVDGYVVDYNGNNEITVEAEGDTEFTVINEKEEDPKYDINIRKQIKEDGKVRDWKEGDPEFTFKIKEKDNKEAEEISATTVKGIATFKDLETGVYVLTEAPVKGYKVDYNGNEEINVEAEGKTEFTVINEKEEDPLGSIKIIKKIKVGDEAPKAPGDIKFTFNLLKDGKVIRTGTTDDKGILIFDKLPVGEYEIKEVDSKGYKTSLASTNNKVKVLADKTTVIEVVNTKDKDLPFTGGFAEEEILFAIAGAFVILLGLKLRKVR